MAVSPDGRWVAELTKAGDFQLWPTAPPWPREALALVAAGAVLILGRGRMR